MIVHAASASGERPGGNVVIVGALLRCDCGADDVFSIRPGADDESADLLGTRVVTRRGDALRCWCEPCWRESLR